MANDLQTMVDQRKADFAALLDGTGMSPARFINMFFSGLRSSYQLTLCAKESPETVIRCLLQAAAVGVEVNTPLQHSCIIPRKRNEKWTANFQMMYRGLMHLAVVHGSATDWRAFAVYEGDHFIYRPSDPHRPIEHEPDLDRADNAKIRGAYSIVFLPSGLMRAVWMRIAEIREIRDRYSESWKAYLKDKSKTDTPWLQREGEMSIKTVVINQAKQLRLAGPPPVMIGSQAWERGAVAAARHLNDDEDIEDAELTEEERPRAKESRASVAVGNVPNNQGPTRRSEPAEADPKLNLVRDNEPTPESVTKVDDGNAGVSAPETEDRILTAEEAKELQLSAVSLGLNFPAQRKVLSAFKVDSYEKLLLSQRDMVVHAIHAEGNRKASGKGK